MCTSTKTKTLYKTKTAPLLFVVKTPRGDWDCNVKLTASDLVKNPWGLRRHDGQTVSCKMT
jgi:hypothetical protein